MSAYSINYIDGFDNKYKSYETNAESEKVAVLQLFSYYKGINIEHSIIEITRLKGSVPERMRIGDIPRAPLSPAREITAAESETLS